MLAPRELMTPPPERLQQKDSMRIFRAGLCGDQGVSGDCCERGRRWRGYFGSDAAGFLLVKRRELSCICVLPFISIGDFNIVNMDVVSPESHPGTRYMEKAPVPPHYQLSQCSSRSSMTRQNFLIGLCNFAVGGASKSGSKNSCA